MSPRILPVACVVAAALTFVPSALAVGTSSVTTPSDASSYTYDVDAAPTIAVSGTATGMAAVDLRCAHEYIDTWYFEAPLAGGGNVPVSGGSFSAPSVSLPTHDNALCRLVAVPTGTTPTDLTGLSGPSLRLSKVVADLDSNGGANDGKQYDFFESVGGGATATVYIGSAGDDGLDSTYLATGDPSEQGQVFGFSGFIPLNDPAGAVDASNGKPLAGMLVDGVDAYNGAAWEEVASGSTRIPFAGYSPFPLVTVTQSTAADGSSVVSEHDAISECFGSDPNYYPPGGFTCQGLQDSGVALDVATSVSPAGNVVDRLWRLSSTDGRAHQVALWMGNDVSGNALPRAWKGPGEAGYAQRRSGDTIAPPAAGPWAAEFHSVGAADGDTSEGVGAIVVGSVPATLRFDGAYELDAKFDVAVPASGSAQLDTVYMSEATQAALDADVAAALARLSGRGGGGSGGSGGGGGGGAGGGGGNGSAPALARTGKATLSLRGLLSLGYRVSCPADAASACSASIVLTQPVRRAARRRRAHHAAKRKARPRTLGTLTVSVPPGRTLALATTIARKNRAFFKTGHITMTARLSRPGLTTQTLVKPLPVKIAKPKPRRRAHRR